MDSSANIHQTTLLSDNDISFPKRSQRQMALADIMDGIYQWRIWILLAYQDIRLRYRRSVLGPFWITLSMAITVYSMGFLYAHLFKTDMKTYYPFLVAGMLSWSLISIVIMDMTETFIAASGFIKQIKLPYTLHIHRVAARNVIIFFHNIVVILPIMIIFHESMQVNLSTLLLIPNLFIIYINAISYGLILALLGARYRDISQTIKSLVQVAFFVTPIMWNPAVLPQQDRIFVILNPFYAFVELIRAPLTGSLMSASSVFMVFMVTLLGIVVCASLFIRYRARIIYWL